MAMMRYYPVILSGGSGTRLWPLSREHYPKPLLPLLGDRTLLQETTCRMAGLDDAHPPLYVCNEEHRFLLAEQVHELGIVPSAIMLEPAGRNTAPALTLAALHLSKEDPRALMVVMPADHIISDARLFLDAIRSGSECAAGGSLVTFGVVPDQPETGYGYIRRGKGLQDADLYEVAEFVEKPDMDDAKGYLEAGEYYWNSGIFMMRADRWLEELEHFRADIAAACRAAYAEGKQDNDFFRVGRTFRECPADSIDYAVMEKTRSAAVVPLNADWSDVGAWSSLWDVSRRDEQGNLVHGDVITIDTHDALLLAKHRFLATVGMQDVIVVETADAVLVADMRKAQDVKAVVEMLKTGNRQEYRIHRRVNRPWGAYEGIDAGGRYQVKRLTVKPGAALSLQMHHHRAEHWIVVTGTARVTCGEKVFLLGENESTYIPLGERHRLENPGTIPLEIIEVQSGSYLGEDDIVRFEDVYNRCENG
jgi:mannose-1-phosphate guanylyltransferase/mannose-6-phosphate isomerase